MPQSSPPEAPPRPRRRILVWVIALLAIAATVGYYFYQRSTASESGAPTQPSAQGGAGQGGAGRGGAGRQGKGGGGPGGGAQANRPLPVVAEDAKSGDMEVFLNALGSVTPLNVVTVRTRVDPTGSFPCPAT